MYGASIMVVLGQKFLLPARLLYSRPKKVQRLSLPLRKASEALAAGSDRCVPLAA